MIAEVYDNVWIITILYSNVGMIATLHNDAWVIALLHKDVEQIKNNTMMFEWLIYKYYKRCLEISLLPHL